MRGEEAVASANWAVGLSGGPLGRGRAAPATAVAGGGIVGQVGGLLSAASKAYARSLASSPRAVRYLAERGIGGRVAGRYALGYARPIWRQLDEVLKGHDETVVDESGLTAVSQAKPGGSRFDRFRDRIMAPVRRLDGSVAGFVGRRLVEDEKGPKYLNSPEGVCFKKRELLFGLYEAQGEIESTGEVLVVEGVFDVLAAVQAGLGQTVGTLGTACSPVQLELLTELAGRVVFCFDGDEAGGKAAGRAAELAAASGKAAGRCWFAELPGGHDVDSFVRAYGGEALRHLMRDALPLVRFLEREALIGCDLGIVEGRARFLGRTRDQLALMSDEPLRGELLQRCADRLGIGATDVQRALWAH